ncbi:hypothetical protein AtNW77_Chr1g0040631 [Arabidopsis thaliana]
MIATMMKSCSSLRRNGVLLFFGESIVVSYVVTLFLCRFMFSECMSSHRRFRINRCFAMSGDCAVNFPALLVVCLVILTYDISYVIVPGRHYDLLWVFRNLTQILLELICHHRPAQKPPWKQYVEEELRLIGESEDGLYHINKNERCNEWITAYDFRMRYRYFICKKKMILKQESHTKLTEMMKTIKYLTKKAECNLLYHLFVT